MSNNLNPSAANLSFRTLAQAARMSSSFPRLFHSRGFLAKQPVNDRTGRYQQIAMVALAPGRVAHLDQRQVGGKTRDAKYLAGETPQDRDRRRQSSSSGSATSNCLASCASLRISAAANAFQKHSRSPHCAGAPDGSISADQATARLFVSLETGRSAHRTAGSLLLLRPRPRRCCVQRRG